VRVFYFPLVTKALARFARAVKPLVRDARTMRILVTGSAGFIGFHMARRLLDEGHEPVFARLLSPTMPSVSGMERTAFNLIECAVARQVGGVSDVTVWKLAKLTGIKLAGKGVVTTPEKRTKIIAALKTKRNARAVVREVGGVSLSTVKKIAKQARVKLAGKGVVTTPEKRAKIIAALKAARSPNESAA
jgi:hypothetical protein